MRYKIMLFTLIILLASSTIQLSLVEGEGNKSVVTQTLSKDSIIELALKNYVEVRFAQLSLQLSGLQLDYTQIQKDIVSEVGQSPTPSKLPTLFEELRKQIPNYDQLSDEEKSEVNQMIQIQIMINHSFNQFIDTQNAAQFNLMLKEKELNLLTLSENIRSLMSNKSIAALELEKTKKLVRFYAVQQYYRLLNMINNLKSAEIEESHASNRFQDAMVLYKNGLITETEMEKAKVNAQKQRDIIEHLARQYELQLKMFKLELGIEATQKVTIETVHLKQPKEVHTSLSISIEGNLELQLADEAIKLAKENYDSVSKTNLSLTSYYLRVLDNKKEQKAVIKQQLEQRLLLLEQEGNSTLAEVNQLVEEQVRLTKKIEDYKKLLQSGRITIRELEDLQHELSKLDLAVDNANLNYGTFQEKQELARQGILLIANA